MSKPKVVCLCGSTKFKKAFEEANKSETLKGNIILSVGCFPHSDNNQSPEKELGGDVKLMLDDLHKRKIDLADEVFILNVGNYVGKSTRNEIKYAEFWGKPVRYLENRNYRPAKTV
jgi:hypothetical protein